MPNGKPVYRWNPSDDRWQMWNGRRWVRSVFYDAFGEHFPPGGPTNTMSYEDTFSDLQETQ